MGYEITLKRREADRLPDLDDDERREIASVLEYTMTGSGQVASLRDAVRYVEAAGIAGDIVECGVWRGGSMMAVARTLMQLGSTHRNLYLFDTFAGMAEPGPEDQAFNEARRDEPLQSWREGQRPDGTNAYCLAGLDDVQQNMRSTQYPWDRIHFVKGKVEDTIPAAAPAQIAILRLDTDWYASTKHELEHLYPRLARGGVLIIDDYGMWRGSRKAADEYFRANDIHLFLERQSIAEARSTVKR